jgi:MscS family membrane protein
MSQIFAAERFRVLIAALLMLLASPAVWAQGAGQASAAGAAAHDELGRDTPRGAAVGYLTACRAGDYERAAHYLDLRRIDPATRDRAGPRLARQLQAVLDRELWVPVDQLSQASDGITDDGLPPFVDRIGVIDARKGPVDIDLARVARDDGPPVWLVSASTVSRIPSLYKEFGYGPLERWLPKVFFEVRVLEVLLWQWLGLLVITFAAWLLSYIGASAVVALVRPLAARTQTDLDDRLFDTTLPPLRLLMAIFLFWVGSRPLGLAVPAETFLAESMRSLVLVAITWLLMRLVNVVAEALEQRLESRGQESAVPLVAPGRKAVKAVIFLIAFVAVLDNFGFNVTALVAGLGVGGIAVALAAQKSIENLFGGIMLFADRPVRPGQFCRFGDQVGTVEDIGLRSTRIRTLDRTVVTVPNSEFSALHIENFARRDFIRLYATLGLRYETTPEQLRHVLVEVRKLLYSHPMISNDPARIRFVGFGAYSLDLEIFAYVTTSDWAEFLGVREDVFLRIMDLVEASGTGFAFPSQTLYLGKDGGLDDERARAAEAEVREWREHGQLSLPDFSDDQIRALDGRHPWPPPGSPGDKHDSGYAEKGSDSR